MSSIKPQKILLVGSSGFLGSALAKGLNVDCFAVDSVNREQLDLSKKIPAEFAKHLENNNYHYVIICAAITNVEQCFQNQTLSQNVNVRGTQELLDLVHKSGAIPVFFSSDYVFSGKTTPYLETDPRKPQTVYGQQKLAIENYLENNFDKYLIFRTSKLMSKDNHPKNILYSIIQNLAAGKASQCFEDQLLNPVCVEDIAEVLKSAFVRDLNGVFHLGTRRIFTRAELARLLASSLGYDKHLIESILMTQIKFSEPRPSNNTLCSQKIEDALNYRFCEVEEAIAYRQ